LINDFYSLGLRHAVDAGQIAAIDNVTRKLMPEDKKPISVGCFFSLGHSTIVVLMSIDIALGARACHQLGGLTLVANNAQSMK
jgi:high-affinity nickel-transport protein